MNRACLTLLGVAALGAAVSIAVVACGKAPPKEERLLVLDGIEIRLADVEPYVAFLDSFLREAGRKTKIQRVLDEYAIPVRLARRAFPEQRADLLKRANGLCEVATNVAELQTQTATIAEKRRSEMTRAHAVLPVSAYVFDAEQALLRIGAVSPPIEVPEGWIVAGVFDHKQSPALLMSDYADVLQIGFVHHSAEQWRVWYGEQKAKLEASFVHPDYVEAMPTWLRIKKQP